MPVRGRRSERREGERRNETLVTRGGRQRNEVRVQRTLFPESLHKSMFRRRRSPSKVSLLSAPSRYCFETCFISLSLWNCKHLHRTHSPSYTMVTLWRNHFKPSQKEQIFSSETCLFTRSFLELEKFCLPYFTCCVNNWNALRQQTTFGNLPLPFALLSLKEVQGIPFLWNVLNKLVPKEHFSLLFNVLQ